MKKWFKDFSAEARKELSGGKVFESLWALVILTIAFAVARAV